MPTRFFFILLAWLLAAAQSGFVLAESAVRAKLVDGSLQEGTLTTWEKSAITLDTESGSISLQTDQLLSIRIDASRLAPFEDQLQLKLIDGTRLPFREFLASSSEAQVSTLISETPIPIPTALIESVQLMPNAPELDSTDLAGDTLVIYNKKKDSFDRLDGILGEVSPERVLFTWDGEQVPVNRSKVAAMLYFHAKEKPQPEPLCWLELTTGARLPVSTLAFNDQTIRLKTTGGIELSVPLSSIASADYSHDKLVYLSDLKPLRERWTPRINLPASAELIQNHGLPRRDQSYTGSALSLLWPTPKTGLLGSDRRTYDKGLALRSRTETRYRIPKGMTRFMTTAGIDPETAEEGHVVLELKADKQTLWRGEIGGGETPAEINIDLGSARELRIMVDYGENLDFGDRLHLVEARLSK